jgi:hypothetical protein
MGGQRHVPAALLPGRTRYTMYRRLGGPQGRAGRVRKISPLHRDLIPGPSIPAVSHYTDWAIPARTVMYTYAICVVLLYDVNSLKVKEVWVARTVSVGFVVVGMCLGQVFNRLLLFSLVFMILLMLNMDLFKFDFYRAVHLDIFL